jgi:hypothetical protein
VRRDYVNGAVNSSDLRSVSPWRAPNCHKQPRRAASADNDTKITSNTPPAEDKLKLAAEDTG